MDEGGLGPRVPVPLLGQHFSCRSAVDGVDISRTNITGSIGWIEAVLAQQAPIAGAEWHTAVAWHLTRHALSDIDCDHG